ncbi:MAG: DoxX family protein [Dongiaceae bacterium]
MDIGILLLRLAIGLTLAAHGTQKLFGWFGGGGLDKTGEGLARLGFHPGRRHALAAGLVEVSAGVLLAAGLLTPIAAMLVGSLMLVAAISVHVKQGFFITSGGYEYNLVLGIAGLSLAFTGAGALSADALLGFDLSGVLWGIGASLLAVLGAAVQLAQRRTPAHAVTAA